MAKATDAKKEEVKAQEANEKDAVLSEAAPEAKLDEAAPGGVYEVGGKKVNSSGEPIE